MEAKKTQRRQTRKTEVPAKVTSAQLKSLSSLAMIIGAAAIGGAIMYMADPVAGANRRSTLLGRIKSFGSFSSEGLGRQLSSIAGLVTGFFGWANSSDISTAQTDSATNSATPTDYARRVSATDPDAFSATH